jgi:hypothetical protein
MSTRSLQLFFAVMVMSTIARAADLTPEQTKLYADLEASLSGSALVGNFTVTGKETSEPKPERYELTSVKHIGDGNWMFVARIKYGEHDVPLPITLPVKWAGDTPVITVDNMAFPGLGTYTARVMIYADHYAGFWSGATDKNGSHGGHLYGMVEHGVVKEKAAEPSEKR